MSERQRPEVKGSATETEDKEVANQRAEVDGAVGGQAEPPKLKLTQKEANKKAVQWTEETVDNEHMGKKSSKSCCIYHKPKPFKPGQEESSSDESSDDEDCSSHHGKENQRGHSHHKHRH